MEPEPTSPEQNIGPIGVFDSGVGGLSIWREIVRQMPNERTVYFADQAHVPYGTRSLSEVQSYAKGITRFLQAQGAKIIVVACNTASGAALHELRSTFPDMPFVGMEPAIKPAAARTQTGVIAVIATPATFQGELFHSLVERYATDVRLVTQICPGLVEQVEQGDLDSPKTSALIRDCLSPLLPLGLDHLVLGCTHYPFLMRTLTHIAGPNVALVDPSPAVARQTARVLTQLHLCNSGNNLGDHTFYTSGNPENFRLVAYRLVGFEGPVLPAFWRNARIEVHERSCL